jgi:cell division protein FtsQ
MVVVVLLAGLLFGAWLWLRDSSLVAVNRVTITGVTGANAPEIRSALRSAARNMTTLDVQMAQLHTAVAPFPEVKRLRVRTAFPHRMVIEVIELRPVALVDIGNREVPVAADGTLLRAVSVSSQLPTIPLSVPPVGRRLSEGRAAESVALLAAAPNRLLAKVEQATIIAGHGLVAQLRGGPSLYFGDATQLGAKWAAVSEVLADPGSSGASYIDVTDPGRPAAGAGGTAQSSTTPADPGTTSSTSAATSTVPAAPSTTVPTTSGAG